MHISDWFQNISDKGMQAGKNKFQCLFILNFPQPCVKNQVVRKLEINGKESGVGILDLGILGFWTFPSCGVQKYNFPFQHGIIFIIHKSNNIKINVFEDLFF
jgi:hypothetical protein